MNKRDNCPSALELSRQFSVGADETMTAHVRECARCAAQWDAIKQVVELSQDVPVDLPSPERVQAVRDAITHHAATVDRYQRPIRPWAWVASAVAASVCLILATYTATEIYKKLDPSSAHATALRRATVHSHTGAQYVRAGAQPDEIVRLTKGTITVEVAPLLKGERFRVVAGDAEVEVRGTVFDVTVDDDSLTAVHVITGKVKVTRFRTEPIMLISGDKWTKTDKRSNAAFSESHESSKGVEKASAQETRPRATAISARRRNPISNDTEVHPNGVPKTPEPSRSSPSGRFRAPETKTDPAEASFNQGWNALRRGANLSAAKAFEGAIQLAGSNPIAEDSAFWRAIAYARAGENTQAIHALILFVDRFPDSPRSGEASALLGWKLFETGDIDNAKKRFRTALSDRVSKVRASAQRGLEAIDRRGQKREVDSVRGSGPSLIERRSRPEDQ